MVAATHSLKETLTAVHEAGGYYWMENEPCPLGPMAATAEAEGYLSFDGGATLGAHDGYKLTRKGREFLGLPPTAGDRIAVAARRLFLGAPL
jgi:hypothetical protein